MDLAFVMFLLANAALFVRPNELFPAMGDLQVYLGFIVVAMLAGANSLQTQLRFRTFYQQPVNLCMLGVVVAVGVSHLVSGNIGAAIGGLNAMSRVLIYYLLLVGNVTSVARMRKFLLVIAICSTVMVALSIQDFFKFYDEWNGRTAEIIDAKEKDLALESLDQPRILRHVIDRAGPENTEQVELVYRLCGLGIFHDPNDLSLLIAVTLVISVFFLTDKKLAAMRWLWLGPIFLMCWAIVLTGSRGGFLAFGVGVMAWLTTHYGRKVALSIGVLGVIALPVALGRSGDIDVSGGTGQQRIQLWADGLSAMFTPRFLFGTGEGTYADIAGLVAHNSFIHAFVELGFFGGTMFFGCFFLTAYAVYRIQRYKLEIQDPEVARLLPFVAAILAAWCMGMCSLSRCYVAPTYMVAGLGAAFVNLAGFFQKRPRPIVLFDKHLVPRLTICSLALLIFAFAFVRTFARFS